MCFYSELRFAQNALALMTGDEDYDDYYSYGLSRKKIFPSEFGINFGIASKVRRFSDNYGRFSIVVLLLFSGIPEEAFYQLYSDSPCSMQILLFY